ncbi:hypothetical protein PVAND_015944 [Polypedilum vanderplanki]|uniref:Uncharacterized protein n=1 Tax=Polypedilum vanderplanki TaxID=319348 RepID=A0A9J6BER4_POLVA|nr:hypothetical protein PVAND_015944 [Polypedilum vanderplanki]
MNKLKILIYLFVSIKSVLPIPFQGTNSAFNNIVTTAGISAIDPNDNESVDYFGVGGTGPALNFGNEIPISAVDNQHQKNMQQQVTIRKWGNKINPNEKIWNHQQQKNQNEWNQNQNTNFEEIENEKNWNENREKYKRIEEEGKENEEQFQQHENYNGKNKHEHHKHHRHHFHFLPPPPVIIYQQPQQPYYYYPSPAQAPALVPGIIRGLTNTFGNLL